MLSCAKFHLLCASVGGTVPRDGFSALLKPSCYSGIRPAHASPKGPIGEPSRSAVQNLRPVHISRAEIQTGHIWGGATGLPPTLLSRRTIRVAMDLDLRRSSPSETGRSRSMSNLPSGAVPILRRNGSIGAVLRQGPVESSELQTAGPAR